ncbi:MAG: YdeI/OmpD-associated family protein [Verrucomicrobia bacterium]|nr:YdeI/OmpD-associated family protein [Verrucomicrobiota bacterium]
MVSDRRVDAYVAAAAPFARPILRHLRALVRRTLPEVVETMKWGMPHFTFRGVNLGGMAAFQVHAAFYFWHQQMTKVVAAPSAGAGPAMGNFGRITRLADLPSDATMRRYLRHAAKLIEQGVPARDKAARPRPVPRVPRDLAAALRGSLRAARTFRALSPSCRRDYIEWVTEAKRPETRQRRLATAITWLAAGRRRDWKHRAG